MMYDVCDDYIILYILLLYIIIYIYIFRFAVYDTR